MSLAAGGRSRDLVFTALAALASLVLIALPFEGLLKAIALLPLVLVLPGYALAAALFPRGELSVGERAVYSLGLSVGAAALAGLAWQFAFGLTRTSWALLLATVALAACALAQQRRGRIPAKNRDRYRPRRQDSAETSRPRLDLPTAVTMAIGLAAAIAAIAIATDGLQSQRADSRFSALWVIPRGSASAATEIGVLNHQGSVHEYRLEVEAHGRDLQHWRGQLGSRASKRLLLAPGAVQPGTQLVVTLYKDGTLYRRTEMQAGAGT